MDPQPRPTGPNSKGALRKRELAEAALRCLQRGGYATLTARKIAAEAGMSLGHVSYHYATMDDLLSAAYQLASDQLRQTSAGLQDGKTTAIGRLDAFLHAGFTPQFLAPGPLRMRIDLWSAALSHPAIADTERALYDRYRAELVALLNAIAVPGRSDQIALVCDLIMATLDGSWLDWMRRRDHGATLNALRACLDYARLKLT